jgi:hypothetical protein
MEKQETKTSTKKGAKTPKAKGQNRQTRVEKVADDKLSFAHGAVITTIFANRDGHGDIDFRVVQEREYVWNGETCYAKSFRACDLFDKVRGDKEAIRLIQERQRGLRWSRRFA